VTPRPKVVAVAAQARAAYSFTRGIVFAVVGVIIEDEGSGVRVRVNEHGGLDELGAVPARKSIASDPTATRGGGVRA
jgi:hypothetical protein